MVNSSVAKLAEKILVLSDLANIRVGFGAHDVEKRLLSEACELLTCMVSEVPPKCLASTDAVNDLALQLGLKETSDEGPKSIGITEETINGNFLVQQEVENDVADHEASVDVHPSPEAYQYVLSLHNTSQPAPSARPNSSKETFEGGVMLLTPSLLQYHIDCRLCLKADSGSKGVIICDSCEQAFHLACLERTQGQLEVGPPPPDWLCSACTRTFTNRQPPQKYTVREPLPHTAAPAERGVGKLLPTPKSVTSNIDSEEASIKEGISSRIGAAPLPESNGAAEDVMPFSWIGEPSVEEDKLLYQSCQLASGIVLTVGDCALFRPEVEQTPPYISRVQSMWEVVPSGEKWCRVSWFYYPQDLPPVQAKPEAPQEDEVYESNHCDDNLLFSVWGTCLVLPMGAYQSEVQRRQVPGSQAKQLPLYLARYLFDVLSGSFSAVEG